MRPHLEHANFWATICKTLRRMLSVHCLSVLSVCQSETLVHCGQTVGQIKIKLGMQVGLGPGHIVLDGNPAPLVKKGRSLPIFGPYLLWPNGGWIKMPHGREVGLGPRNIVLDGDPAPLPKKGAKPPNFRPICIVAKRLDGSRWHLAWSSASVQATLC